MGILKKLSKTAVFIGILMFSGVMAGCGSEKEESYRSIQVYDIDGTAWVTREDIGEMELYANMQLQSNDRLRTDGETYVQLKLDEDKYILVEPNTSIKIEAEGNAQDSKTKIVLEEGSIVNRIENKLSENSNYEVETPNSTMAVRGTTFKVEIEKDSTGKWVTGVDVQDGKVDCKVMIKNEDGTVEEQVVSLEAGKRTIIIGALEGADYVSEPVEYTYDEYEEVVLNFIGYSEKESEDSEKEDITTEDSEKEDITTEEATDEEATEKGTKKDDTAKKKEKTEEDTKKEEIANKENTNRNDTGAGSADDIGQGNGTGGEGNNGGSGSGSTDNGSGAGSTDGGSSTGGTDSGSNAGSPDSGSSAGSTDGGSSSEGTDNGSGTGGTDSGSGTGSTDSGNGTGSTDGGSGTGSTDSGNNAGSPDSGSGTGSTDSGSGTGSTDNGSGTGSPDSGSNAGGTDSGSSSGSPDSGSSSEGTDNGSSSGSNDSGTTGGEGSTGGTTGGDSGTDTASYTVTFTYNGTFATQTVTSGSTATEPVLMPTSAGTWCAPDGNAFDFSTKITSDITLNWIDTSNSGSPDSGGSSGSTDSGGSSGGTDSGGSSGSTDSGSSSGGTDSGTTGGDSGTDTASYTVTFTYNGTFATQTVTSGSTATEPVLMPTSAGTWCAPDGNAFDFSTTITSDTTLNWIDTSAQTN